jgi:hypothetical protein
LSFAEISSFSQVSSLWWQSSERIEIYGICGCWRGYDNEAKVYACQEGKLFIQHFIKSDGTTDNNLVNVIIKPSVGLDIPMQSVKYYIYRGVLKSSLLKNDASPASLFSGAATYVKSDLSVHSEIS